MPFAYFDKLSAARQAEYRRSVDAPRVDIPAARELRPVVDGIRSSLEGQRRSELREGLQRLADELAQRLEVPRVRVRVLGVRPTIRRGSAELHGAYQVEEGRRRIEVWMKTAAQGRTVKFRTFLRTFLHEFVHHLDMTRLNLPNSFHTEGFFQRESHLMRQLAPSDRAASHRS
jgi:hypothetical protein